MNKAEALKILGFSAGEDPDEQAVKKAFKKKAAKLHPDVNKADDAEQQFKDLNAAHEYLLNPPPEPAFHDFSGARYTSTNSSSNPFADFFRHHAGPRVHFSVPPIQKTIRISFRDAVLGSRQKIKVDKQSRCDDCLCQTCGGTGRVEQTSIQANMMFTQAFPCNVCRGEGRRSDGCATCSGRGVVRKVSEFSINIPGGITNGASMRLRGFGNVESHNGLLFPGDIVLTINVEHDKDMRIQGANVISTIDISLLEAIQGTKRRVRTVLGETDLSIKKNTKHKDTIVLERHGVEKQGSHIFMINVLYPKDTTKLIEALKDK
jgi:molecular chaperone DnaJ